MKTIDNYTLVKNNDYIKLFNYHTNISYPIDEKEIKDLKLANVLIVNDALIDQYMMKRINNRFKKILEYIASIYEDDDDDTSDSLLKALNQVEKFKMELINKDRKYIEKEHIELISKKVKIIEKELQDKMYAMALRRRQNEMFMQMMMQGEYQEQNRRSR
jgi:predicted ATP-dependent protease